MMMWWNQWSSFLSILNYCPPALVLSLTLIEPQFSSEVKIVSYQIDWYDPNKSVLKPCLTELTIGFDAMDYSGSEGKNVQLTVSVISGKLSLAVTVFVHFRTVSGTANGELLTFQTCIQCISISCKFVIKLIPM